MLYTIVNYFLLQRSLRRFPQRFAGYTQQDSQEFLTFLLEGLHEDVNTAEGEAVDPRSCDSEDGSTGTTKVLLRVLQLILSYS